jgi:isoleucyl-tRNA synthetase
MFRSSPAEPDSVHLADWPTADTERLDPDLVKQMALVRRLVELGRAARADSGVKTRQPLGRALVAAKGWPAVPPPLQQYLSDELNVQNIELLGTAEGEFVQVTAKANFRSLGKRFGNQTPTVASAIAVADAETLSRSIRSSGAAEVVVDGESVSVGSDDVVFTETPRAGWAVQHEGGESIALDLTLTPDLRRLGFARDAVRLVQSARKSAGFHVSDRIILKWQGDGEPAAAVLEHANLITAEVLAVALERFEAAAETPGPADVHDPELGLSFWLSRDS